ncbi:hypothetical protein [Pseudomonas amygdali]|uniref:hypothetical protein n=1 Tax=Pseudomonas amygdali TaxID=47877 RepID=UPI0009B0B9F0|nr:hypothetical protein [Pseudomonas amygdali]ARA80215.1 hypothetical protein B5U27_09175 [Pseudomonas amygdali pv. lachrymans]
MSNEPNDVRVSRELLERMRQRLIDLNQIADFGPELFEILNRRAQPADQHAPFPGYPPVPDDRKLPADQQGEQMARMPVERCYDVRAKMIIAFNESKKAGGDLDDQLDAAYKSALRFSPNPDAKPATAKMDERLTQATAFVQKLRDAAAGQPSFATGYLSDILDVLQGRPS